jgi:cAMP-dependent protein kinase regulator
MDIPTSPVAHLHNDDADNDDEVEKQTRHHFQARGRRGVVFSEPVQYDQNYIPPVYPKTEEEILELKSVIKNNVFLKELDEKALNQILFAMMPKKFELAGTRIIQQGDHGDFYYILTNGTVSVYIKKATEQTEQFICDLNPGSGFGELALLYDSPRAATVSTKTDNCYTWAIDRVTFKQLLVQGAIQRRSEYKMFLSKVPFLSQFSDHDKAVLSDILLRVHVKKNEVVIQEGDMNADFFYIVETGELKATKSTSEAEVCPRLVSGSYFGELALLSSDNKPRAATITAVEDSVLLAIDKAGFVRLLGPVSEVFASQQYSGRSDS